MLIWVLPAQVRDPASLSGVEIELEPLMSRAEVVDLEAPVALVALIAKLSGNLIAAYTFKSAVNSVGPLYDDGLNIGLYIMSIAVRLLVASA